MSNRLVPILLLWLSATGLAADEPAQAPPPHRVFPSSRFDIDAILTRPYTPEVPFGSTGERLWATSPQGWAFADDVQWLYLTNFRAFDVDISDPNGPIEPATATYFPSHVHMAGGVRPEVGRASASFTYTLDNAQNPLTKPFRPAKRWTCWSSGRREDWYAVDLGSTRTLKGLRVFFFDDAPGGECRPPERLTLKQFNPSSGRSPDDPRGLWEDVKLTAENPEHPAKGENVLSFAPIAARALRLDFRHAGDRFYTGLYGIEPIFADDAPGAPPAPAVTIAADKFITADDVLVSVIRVTNPTDEPQRVQVVPRLFGAYQGVQLDQADATPAKPGDPDRLRLAYLEARGTRKLHDQEVQVQFRWTVAESKHAAAHGRLAAFESRDDDDIGPWRSVLSPNRAYELAPGESIQFKGALAMHSPEIDTEALEAIVRDPKLPTFAEAAAGARPAFEPDRRDPVPAQVAAYQGWFDANLPYFDCSDPWVRKMYYHRAYNLRKNMLEPKLGALKWPTQAEGRWRSSWYPNVISYGAGHQIREARWLRDPRSWQGHLTTWAVNQKPDHVYPSHVTPKGPAGGQYTDWISSTAWDGSLIHPDREFLAGVVDKLADNVRGWQTVYDPDGDGLLRVDSHWWTGMEYQPSFFYFSDYKPAADFNEPANKVSLERVDLTAYNFGNAVNVARIYKVLSQPEKAKEFDDLAAKIASTVAAKMWKEDGRFFYSLRADDDAVADVKEIIGVYPFYFGMFPPGKGYEAAWASVLDPEQFWTPWPVASCSKQCPAYSQQNWPGDGRRTACMWNGPTWPHANAIVLTAMARTIRADRALDRPASPLTRAKLWELFHSFTKAQYRDGDIHSPWTGEYYDGVGGTWKTAERDYNHSTYLDLLIPDIVGLVPREDDVLEIDPLVPDGALEHFLLDGQHYRGHDVTVVWDDPGGDDHYGDGREGLDVYLDGKRVASADRLTRLRVDLRSGTPIADEDR